MGKPIVSVDFDGVIHSYTSGWKGAANIPDSPVDGALEFIVTGLDRFRIAIFSSRSHQWGGRRAMKAWLRGHLYDLGMGWETNGWCPEWWKERIMRTAFADPWHEEVDWASRNVVKQVEWPLFKPPALVTIDDRAIRFDGTFPSFDAIRAFKPWNKVA